MTIKQKPSPKGEPIGGGNPAPRQPDETYQEKDGRPTRWNPYQEENS